MLLPPSAGKSAGGQGAWCGTCDRFDTDPAPVVMVEGAW
jgi:hypothetical protein